MVMRTRLLRTFLSQTHTASLIWFVLLLLLAQLHVPVLLFASSISQEVTKEGELPVGTLVSINPDDNDSVILANNENSKYLFGVVSVEGTSLAELGREESGLLIATNGDVSTVVTTLNGNIASGDILTVSSIEGVAASATIGGGTTLGVALEDFNANSSGARVVSATDKDGDVETVVIGTIPVRLAINDYYIETLADENILQSTGERLVGRPVSLLQALVAGAIALSGVIIGGYSVYASVSGSFISVGRNPLSSTAVFNGLFYVTLIGISIIVVGVVSGYLVLLI